LEEYYFLKMFGLKEYPSHKVILVEKYIDNRGRLHQVFHTLFGRRTNDALSRAAGYLASKETMSNIGIAVHDNGFALIYPSANVNVIDIRKIKSHELRDILKRAIINTELMRRRFRHVATRGLMILRNYKGHEISVNKQQINAITLLKVIKNLDSFPLLEETFREIMEDYMDIEHAEYVLKEIERGNIKVIELPKFNVPSPFAHNIVLEGLSDVIFMEDRRALLEKFHNKIMELISKNIKINIKTKT